jgi:hypothetical protein
MPLQRFEALAILKTNQVVRGHRFLDGDRGLGWLERCFRPARRDPQQGCVNLADQSRNFGRRGRIVAEVGRHDVRSQIDVILARGISHGLNLLEIVVTRDIKDVGQQPVATLRSRTRAQLVEYERDKNKAAILEATLTRNLNISGTLVEVRTQLVDRCKPHHALGHLCLDRAVGIQ